MQTCGRAGSPQKWIIRGRGKTKILVALKIFYDNSKRILRVVTDPHMTVTLAPSLVEAPSAPPQAFNHTKPIPWGGATAPPNRAKLRPCLHVI